MSDPTWDEAFERIANLVISEEAVPVVYFISAVGKPRHPVKIGKSTTAAIVGRLSSIQTGYPHPLEFQFVCEGGHEAEREMHSIFKEYRMRGEWFRCGKHLADFLRIARETHPDWRRLLSPLQVNRAG